jgi:hypothetical protein
LLVDGVHDRARIGREPQGGIDVTDLADRVACDLLDVKGSLGGDLTRYDDQAGVDECLACHAPGWVLGEDGIEHAVGDLVGHLVRVPLGDGLGCEEVFVVGVAHGNSAPGKVGSTDGR